MNTSDPGMAVRLGLVRSNRAAVYQALCRAVTSGLSIHDAVVILADTSDPIGLELGEAAAKMVGLDDPAQAVRFQRRAELSTAVMALSLIAARAILAARHPNVAASLDREPGPGCVRVIVIAVGAPTLVHTDVRPTSPIVDA